MYASVCLWNGDPSARCIDKRFLWFFNDSFNILTDVIIIILPMPVLSALKLSIKQKIGVMMVFALEDCEFTFELFRHGTVLTSPSRVCLASILRLRSLYIVSKSDDVVSHFPSSYRRLNVRILITTQGTTPMLQSGQTLKSTQASSALHSPLSSPSSLGSFPASSHPIYQANKLRCLTTNIQAASINQANLSAIATTKLRLERRRL